jgi:hypothetical protein
MGRPWRAPVPPIQFEEASAWHEGKIVGIPGDGGGRENSREFADWPQERAVGTLFRREADQFSAVLGMAIAIVGIFFLSRLHEVRWANQRQAGLH